MNRSFDQDHGPPSNMRTLDTSAGSDLRGPSSASSGPNDEASRMLDAALYSPLGIEKLLNRLKQSIFSAQQFSSVLRERSSLEDRYAQGYRRLVRNTSDSLRKPEARQGSYAHHFHESLKIVDRVAENGLQFANSLYTMAEELRDMADKADKERKHWKHYTVDAEKKLSDAEVAQQKAKDRYNNAAEQYDRVRTGEKQGGRLALKNKSQAQQEEALRDKTDMLDQDYTAKSRAAQDQRHEFENTLKPQIVRNLHDQITECDAAVAMQMAKLASISEKHFVGNGMAIAPIRTGDSTGPEPRGLRQIAQDIDDKKDFQDYMLDGIEPPPQFKGRSRRNTDAEMNQTPIRSSQNANNRLSGYDLPYNNFDRQNQNESQAPQLPQIGNQESFSRSFELQRPGAQNQDSFTGPQPPDTLQKTATVQSQQTGVTQEVAPSLGILGAAVAGRTVSSGPQLPAFGRAQTDLVDERSAPPRSDTMGRTSFDRPPEIPRQDGRSPTSPTGPGQPRQTSMNATGLPNQNQQRQDTMGMTSMAGQSPPRHDTMGPMGMPAQNQQRHDTMGPTGVPVQNPQRHDTMGPTVMPVQNPQRQDTMGPTSGLSQNQQRQNTIGPAGFVSSGSPRQDKFGPTNYMTQNQAPLRQDTNVSGGFATQGQQRQETGVPASFVGQGPPRQDTMASGGFASQGPPRQDTFGPGAGRGQPPMNNVSGPFTGRGGPAPGSYMDPGRNNGPYGTAPAGRGQQPTGQRNLPSQQPQRPTLPPNNPVFGMHLDDLFRRDGGAVPAIVFQCIQAVDVFGLHTEGIYRKSGSMPIVMQLKSEFDHDSNLVQLNEPSSFGNDIASVATLLKNFLRDLPDPLLTNTAYHSFIQAAKYEDPIMRRDALHQYINSLPDPNYATLRVLVLHLHRVSTKSDINKMDMNNLAIVLGPTLMGANNAADAGWQTKVLETILQHTHDIFDPDDM